MLLCACAYDVKSEISLDIGDSASNVFVKRFVLLVFINQRCAECVCLYIMNFVSAGKNTLLLLLLYVTVCEEVVPRLNKHDDVIKWNFMKIALPRNEELVAPLLQPLGWRYVECVIHHEQNVREEQHHIYLARISNNRVIVACDLYCCLFAQCEALRTCRSGFPIVTVAIVTGRALFVTSHCDVKFTFPIQRFGEVLWHNAYHYTRTLLIRCCSL